MKQQINLENKKNRFLSSRERQKKIMKGVLLNNLGSPDSTDTKDVKKYLGEFLMDERVITFRIGNAGCLLKG